MKQKYPQRLPLLSLILLGIFLLGSAIAVSQYPASTADPAAREVDTPTPAAPHPTGVFRQIGLCLCATPSTTPTRLPTSTPSTIVTPGPSLTPIEVTPLGGSPRCAAVPQASGIKGTYSYSDPNQTGYRYQHIRSGPGTNYSIIGQLRQNESREVYWKIVIGRFTWLALDRQCSEWVARLGRLIFQ